MKEYEPFKSLEEKIEYVKGCIDGTIDGMKLFSMFTEEGNKLVSELTKKACQMILSDIDSVFVAKITFPKIEDISKTHKEIYDTDVKESMFYYINICTEYMKNKYKINKEKTKLIDKTVNEIYNVFDNFTDLGAEDEDIKCLKNDIKNIIINFKK